MNSVKVIVLAVAFAFFTVDPLCGQKPLERSSTPGSVESVVIENFESGHVTLTSYPGEDLNPNSWALDTIRTYNNSHFSLKLYGNTWKIETIQPVVVDSGDVWRVAAYVQSTAEIQGFGLMDSLHTLFYSFSGSEMANIAEWVPVYQGAFSTNTWNLYPLPVADDWLDRFGYLPRINKIVFVNDRDAVTTGIVYFDDIIDITSDLPIAPRVQISYNVGQVLLNSQGQRSVTVHFTSTVYDPDSRTHQFYWYFGDDSTSRQQNPVHTYVVEDDHQYSVLLEVVDSTGMWGRAACQVEVDPGMTSFPITMNFVGDVMMARKYENPGGIIPTLGVNAIFAPTRPYLGGAVDITVANLECALTNTGTPHPTKSVVFRSSPSNVSGLVYAGIDVVTIANNHIIDYGLDGLQQTQSVLGTNRIVYFGAGGNSYEALRPAFYAKSGLTFAFLGFSDRTGQYNNYQPYLDAGFSKPGFANLTRFNLVQQINTARNVADRIIVQMHSGVEYSFAPMLHLDSPSEEEDYSPFLTNPLEGDREIRRFAIDSGADVVICHHPHVAHGFEVYQGKLIAHSLGNFAFDLDYTETMPTAILNAEITGEGFSKFTITPVFIDDYIPVRAKGDFGNYILDYLAMRSRELGTYVLVNRDSVSATIVLDTLRLRPITTSQTDTATVRQRSGAWISDPLRLRRSGTPSIVTSVNPARSWQYRAGRDLVWFGNFENEGCTLWDMNDADERYDTTAFFQGRRSLRQRRTAGSGTITTSLENRLVLRADSLGHTIYGYIRSDNSRSAKVSVSYYDTRIGYTPLATYDIGTTVSGTTPWTFYSNDVTPPTYSAFIDVLLQSSGPTSGTGYTWFDNVGLIEWSEWRPVSSSQSLPTPNDYTWIQVKATTSTSQAIVSYDDVRYEERPTHSPDVSLAEPSEFRLLQNYPNPFNPSTRIEYKIPTPTRVIVKIYNLLGQEIRTLVDEVQPKGKGSVEWDGRNSSGLPVSSGVYFCTLAALQRVQAKKLLLLR